MKFTLTLEDDGKGIKASCNFAEGFNKLSNSHQIGNLILKYLDSLLEKDEAREIEGAPV